ncbi:hypothetical protein C8J56DRAFT_971876 [Mycena floridula]|nr:hypothetical protein C8J56DRAFT_971876 [Mycena floridula]
MARDTVSAFATAAVTTFAVFLAVFLSISATGVTNTETRLTWATAVTTVMGNTLEFTVAAAGMRLASVGAPFGNASTFAATVTARTVTAGSVTARSMSGSTSRCTTAVPSAQSIVTIVVPGLKFGIISGLELITSIDFDLFTGRKLNGSLVTSDDGDGDFLRTSDNRGRFPWKYSLRSGLGSDRRD